MLGLIGAMIPMEPALQSLNDGNLAQVSGMTFAFSVARKQGHADHYRNRQAETGNAGKKGDWQRRKKKCAQIKYFQITLTILMRIIIIFN